jgi:hypothetical protein
VNAAAASRVDDFGADLRQALGVWSKQPLLPIISVLWWTVPVRGYGDDAVTIVLGIVTFLAVGWPGTEREWYRRAFTGAGLAPSEILPTTWHFFGRFFRLALLAIPFVILLVALSAWSDNSPVVDIGLALVLVFLVDVAFTFVTPALTFTTSSAREALSIGFAILRANWPAAAPYALTPALVVILGAQTLLQPVVGTGGTFLATAVAGLLALAIKGATVAFYLRHQPAPSA